MTEGTTTGPVRDVLITDVLLRDGLQIEPVVMPTADKLTLGRGLLAAGFTSLEVGSFVNPAKVPTMADSEEVLTTLLPTTGAALHTLVFNERGAQRAIAAGARDVRLVVSASDGHSKSNAGVDTAAALDRLEPTARLLREAGVGIEASIATAFVCPFDGQTNPETVVRVAGRLIGMGATVLHLADTIGAASPMHMRRTISAVRDAFADQELGLHLHDTYGMASANAWEAVQLGVRRFDAALGGIGGCPFAPGAAGNIATDDLVNMLHNAGIETGIDTERLVAVRDELRVLLGRKLDSSLSAVPASPVALQAA